MTTVVVQRLDFGSFIRPGEETATGKARMEPCLGYFIRHPDGSLLFDTGMGADPDVDSHYHPHRHTFESALNRAGASLDDIALVTNCHLHFDHCGGNGRLREKPIFVQRNELAAARTLADYTIPALVEGDNYVEVDGETEVLKGVILVPTPGHTDGHQSLVVRRDDGVVIVAGQSHDTSSDFGADAIANGASPTDHHDAPLPDSPPWMARLLELDPRLVYFAHDQSVWIP